MRHLFILIALATTFSISAQSFQLDKIRNPFDRSLRDYDVLNDAGEELFYIKAESYQRTAFAEGQWQPKEIRYYRIVFPDARYEAEIPYTSRRKIKRFIRDQRLILNDRLSEYAMDKVIRLYPAFFSQERFAYFGGLQKSRLTHR